MIARTASRWIVISGLIFLTACSDDKPKSKTRQAAPAQVSIVEIKPETIPVVSELPGRIAPMMTADVRPRVTGIVLKRIFEQGTNVTEGDILYQIDPAPFNAKVRSAEATLDSAKAAQQLASQKADRQIQLQRGNVVSQQDAESAVAGLAQANADVNRAEADLQTAQLDLEYTHVRAPISGRIGRALVTEGALVSSTSDPLVTISQIDPVYADFTQPVDNMLRLKNAVTEGKLRSDAANNAIMQLLLEGGRRYPQEGKLLFSEASVNAGTGQIILRGQFPNPDLNLLPGMYVRARLEQASLENAVAVPKQSVQYDTAGKAQVFVVDIDEKVQPRGVTIGWAIGGRWVITQGLEAGDKVVVEGLQKITPGAQVEIEPWLDPSITQNQANPKG